MIDRRGFFRTAGRAAMALPLMSALESAAFAKNACETAPPLPSAELYNRDEDAYWKEVRKQFVIPDDEIYLNNGTVGSCPLPVLRAVFDSYNDTERMAQVEPEDYPIWGYDPRNDVRDPLAVLVGASRDEIALVRNATEGNSFIANGLELQAGDEVLMSDQEHPSGEEPWNLRAKRYGIVVKKFKLPMPPKGPAEILNLINDAITPRTRVIFTSHVSTSTGLVLPVKEIAALGRSKGILTAFDGAHAIGMLKFDLHDIGCDMYSSSPHKWLQAPKGTGFLFVREEVQPRVWNTIATAGWNDPKLKAERFQRIGSSNLPALAGLKAAIEWCNLLGIDRIEKRHRALADYIHAQMMNKSGVQSWTSPDPALRCALVAVNVAPIKLMDVERWLWTNRKIRIRGGGPSKIRLSTPYYLSKSEIDTYLAAYDEFRKQSGAA